MIFIAEFCQNHNGDFELLKEMIYAAKESGCDYAKIQTIFADMVTYRERFEEGLIENDVVKIIKRPYQQECDRLKKLELSLEQQAEFVAICNKAGIKPLTTVFTRQSVQTISELGFTEIKIASYDCGSFPLLYDIKKRFNKLFVSTGASYDSEIIKASEVLAGTDFSLLHAVTIYPTPLNEFHLARMRFLKQLAPSVGWSDHSLVARDGIIGTLAAVYYGADIVERHFTLLETGQTKDGPVSVRPEHVKELKKASALSKEDLFGYLKEVSPDIEITLGDEKRDLSAQELLNRDYFRGRFASKMADGSVVYNWDEFQT